MACRDVMGRETLKMIIRASFWAPYVELVR